MSYRVRAKGPAEGIPGEVFTDPEWILEDNISVRKIRDGVYRVSDLDGFRGTDITFANGRMLFNGEDIETESFMGFVGMLDAVNDTPKGEARFIDNEIIT